jgi:CheY-like chemotaxis protein
MRLAVQLMSAIEVECFTSPSAALAAFAAAPERYPLVITDFEMPRMNGLELAQAIRALSPTVKILMATGSVELTEERVLRHGLTGMVRKPFPPATLESAIEKTGVSSRRRRK